MVVLAAKDQRSSWNKLINPFSLRLGEVLAMFAIILLIAWGLDQFHIESRINRVLICSVVLAPVYNLYLKLTRYRGLMPGRWCNVKELPPNCPMQEPKQS